MISSVHIKNFKSIKALSLDLPAFAVLVGPNGSGKTNIVGALALFGELLRRGTTDPARDLGWSQIIRREKRPARGGITLGVTVRVPGALISPAAPRRPVSRNAVAPPPSSKSAPSIKLCATITLEGSVSEDEVRVRREELAVETEHGRLRIVADNSTFQVEPGGDPELWQLFQRGLWAGGAPWSDMDQAEKGLTQIFNPDRWGQDAAEQTVLRVLNRVRFGFSWMNHLAESCEVSRFRLDASALRSDSGLREPSWELLGPSGEGLPAAVDRLRGHAKQPTPGFKRVLEALQRVYPRILDVRPQRVQPGRLTLLFRERGIEDDLGQANVSDGVLHALALLVMLEGGRPSTRLWREPGLLAIEEPENAIHPWSVRAMIERAQASAARQVLITTQSETVVNAVRDPGSLFIVENDDRKGTLVTPARGKEHALDTILAETGQKLGDVWMDGTLGGVPGLP